MATAPHPTVGPIRRRHGSGPAVLAILILVIAVGAASLLVIRADAPEQGSGVPTAETRDLPPFTGVDLAATNVVRVHVGRHQRVVVHADDNLLSQVTTRVVGGRLVVGARGGFTTGAPMHVDVTVPSVRLIALSGAGTITLEGVHAARLTVDLSGAGVIRASGHAGRLAAMLSGAGKVDLDRLVADAAQVVVDGGGLMTVRATGSLDATVRGFGTVRYAGDPGRVVRTITGAGVVVAAK